MASVFGDALSRLDAERLSLTKILPATGTSGGSGGGDGTSGFPDWPVGTIIFQVPWTNPTTPGGNLPGGSAGSGSTSASGSGSTASSSADCTIWNLWCWVGLRSVLLILGLICVIGSIYLFKDTRELVAGPVRLVKGTVKAAAETAAAAAKAGSE